MIILIDGYNLLKQVIHSSAGTARERDDLVRQLRTYVHKKDHKVVVVFDAGPYVRPSKVHMHGVDVVYSGVKESADDYIREYLTLHKDKEVMLVSADRELRRYASLVAKNSIGPAEFYDILLETLHKSVSKKCASTELIKTNDNNVPELDELMKQATEIVPLKRDDMAGQSSVRAAPSHQMSKKERKLFHKMKKL